MTGTSSVSAHPKTKSEMEGADEEDLLVNSVEKKPQDDDLGDGPTNEFVLNVAFITFMGFLIIEAVFAIIANSQSMLADAMAMSVDAFTYLFNLMAERLKSKHDDNASHHSYGAHDGMAKDDEMMMRQKMLNRKIKKLYLELVPPLISVVALISVSIYAFLGAIETIVNHKPHPKHENTGEEGETNVSVMFLFSTANLLLDIVNMAFFAKLKHFVHALSNTLVGSHETDTPQHEGDSPNSNDDTHQKETTHLLKKADPQSKRQQSFPSNYNTNQNSENNNNHDDDTNKIPSEINIESIQRISQHHLHQQKSDKEDRCSNGTEDSDKVLNLNMCSAYTHVMADTMRSITVLIVSGLAYCVESVDDDLADAAGAVIVSIIIAISLGPLLLGIFSTWSELTVYQKMRQKLVSTSTTKSITVSCSYSESSSSQP